MTNQTVPIICVIIPCKNHARELRDCLNGLGLMKVRIPYEIIVVDSAADENVVSVVKDYPEIKLVRSEEGLDSASARNLGVRHATGDYLAFIDADCIPGTRWLQSAWNALWDGAQMVGGPVFDTLPWHPVASVDNILQFADLSNGRPEGTIDILPACNLAVRREAFNTVGGFPVVYLMEDVFFTTRVAEHWPERCMFIRDMQVSHEGRSGLGASLEHHYRFGHQRGVYGFRTSKKQQTFGRFCYVLPLVVLKRLMYIFCRILQWNRKRLLIYLVLLPLILVGLTSWAAGFRQGCRAALKQS